MLRRSALLVVVTVLGSMALAGCGGGVSGDGPDVAADPTLAFTRVAEVHRSPGCTCCHEWEAYLRGHGYQVSAMDDPDILAFKAANGVPDRAHSCHTALIGGYVVEGHVPIEAIEDLLAGDYAIDGIALPGMPAGSPGMPGEKVGRLEVLTLAGGHTTPFGAY